VVFGWVGGGGDVFFILQIAKHPFLWEAQFFPIYFTNFLVGQLRTAAQRVPVSYDLPLARSGSGTLAGQLRTTARAQFIVPAFAARWQQILPNYVNLKYDFFY
jgi:hypothetical protein